MKYKHKPTIVEAFRYETDGPTPVPEWFIEAQNTGRAWFDGPGALRPLIIRTLKMASNITAYPGDYILKDSKGEIYPLKPKVFMEYFEPIL